jgi:hypothetical protein
MLSDERMILNSFILRFHLQNDDSYDKMKALHKLGVSI